MSGAELTGIRACVFDAYGTLFDFASAAESCREVLGPKFAALAVLWRDKQLQYTWLRGLQRRHADFWQVTGDALDFALETLGIADPVLKPRLMTLYRELKPFSEVQEVLAELKMAGFRNAILSNGTPAMLSALVDSSGIGPFLDGIFSVEEVGVFKPHPKVYALACERLALERSEIVFVSSNAWDAYAASGFGMRVVWCNRYGHKPERLPGKPDFTMKSLAELPTLLGA